MDHSRLERHVADGWSVRQIAAAESTSYTNVRYWLRRHGLKTVGTASRRGKITNRPRQCACGETDPSKFYGNKSSVCAACHNGYTIARGQIAKEKMLAHMGGRCAVCGFNAYNSALQIHHTDPKEKDIGFRHWRGWAWSKIVDELRKCVLLCANCHAGVHSGDVDLPRLDVILGAPT